MKTMELGEFSRLYPIEEKIFIVPTRVIGSQMINKITREGYPTLNLRAISLTRLAFEICEEYIIKKNKLIIDNILGSNLITQILKDSASQDENFFFQEELIDTKTADEIYKVIMELKYAGLEKFPNIKDLDLIYEEYENRLEKLNAMDYHDVILKASQMEGLKEYREKRIGIAYNIEFENVEKKLFEKLIGEHTVRIKMPTSLLAEQPKNYYFTDLEASRKNKQKKINFYGEYGTKNEINYIIKDIMKKKIAIDEVVIAYTDSKYADLINIEFEKEGIPISFGQGLGIESSSVYKFIETIFNWAENYYNLKDIRPIFFNGELKIEAKYEESGEEISPASMYEELVLSRALHGREHYERILNIDDRGRYPVYERLGKYSRDRRRWLKSFFKDLFFALPDKETIKIGDYVPRLMLLIEKYVRDLNKYDGAAKSEVYDILIQIEDVDMEVSREEYFDIILSYIRRKRILRGQAQPGYAFATNFQTAAYTGRKHLYLIGLDSDSLSNKTMESPILLDLMRNSISKHLPFANEAYRYKKYKIRELLTAGFESINIGYSNFDTVEVRAKSPSQIYTELREDYETKKEKEVEKIWSIYGRDLASSGTALETLAECSRKAFFRYRLKLYPLDDVEVKVDRWLDPLQRGTLIHRILNAYFDLDTDGENRQALVDIVEKECVMMQEDEPYILYEVYLREKEEIYNICKNIIDLTEADTEWEILINELAFGTKDRKFNKIFGVLPKIKVDIADTSIQVAGSIDRIDVHKENPNKLRIVDYKTGNRSYFERKLRENIGSRGKPVYDYSETEKFQHYIYMKALEEILNTRRDLFPNPEIQTFKYVFADNRSSSVIKIDFNQDFMEDIEERIKYLINMDILLADKDVVYDWERYGKCNYCDYKLICMADKTLQIKEVE